MSEPGKLHYYASNAFHWAVSETLPGVVRKLVDATLRGDRRLKRADVEAASITLWAVPGDIGREYQIDDYAPQVVGARFLGTHRGAQALQTASVLTSQGVGNYIERTEVDTPRTKSEVLRELLDNLGRFLDTGFDDAHFAGAQALREQLQAYHDAPLTLPLDQLLTQQEGGARAAD